MRFRPQAVSTAFIMRERLQTGRVFRYNWVERNSWYPAGWGINRRAIGRVFGQLHYRACHAPQPVQQRWSSAYRTFTRRHLPEFGSQRFKNNWTAYAWL
jgi:hypothetical protein